jgi:hypothetical protein
MLREGIPELFNDLIEPIANCVEPIRFPHVCRCSLEAVQNRKKVEKERLRRKIQGLPTPLLRTLADVFDFRSKVENLVLQVRRQRVVVCSTLLARELPSLSLEDDLHRAVAWRFQDPWGALGHPKLV